MLPKELAKLVPRSHLMTESEWRALGVQQSRGWVSYQSVQDRRWFWIFQLDHYSLIILIDQLLHKIMIKFFADSLHDSSTGAQYLAFQTVIFQ